MFLVFVSEESFHKLLIDQFQLLVAVQGGELVLAVLCSDLRI